VYKLLILSILTTKLCSNIFNFFDNAYLAIPLTNFKGLIAKPGLYERAPNCSVPS